MVGGTVSLIQMAAVLQVKITIQRRTRDPRSWTFPVLCFVLVATPTITSEATQVQ